MAGVLSIVQHFKFILEIVLTMPACNSTTVQHIPVLGLRLTQYACMYSRKLHLKTMQSIGVTCLGKCLSQGACILLYYADNECGSSNVIRAHYSKIIDETSFEQFVLQLHKSLLTFTAVSSNYVVHYFLLCMILLEHMYW